jgi:acyl-coenzyme A thioesterase PaaI-like protein
MVRAGAEYDTRTEDDTRRKGASAVPPLRDTADFATLCHPACVACRKSSAGGLGLRFVTRSHGTVVAEFDCDPCYQGYPDRVHGGIVALLLDTAMTHCLFSRGLLGVTARMEIRYESPVEIGTPATLCARLLRADRRLYRLMAEIVQDDTVRARAKGTFAPINGPLS